MAFIKNYGIFWERERVVWGKRGVGNTGTLLGKAARAREPVDFRAQAGVYVLYAGVDIPSLRVVYVGQAGRTSGPLFNRFKNHTRDHLWNRWSHFSWFGVFDVGKQGSLVHTKIDKNASLSLPGILDHLEGALITLMEPSLNKRGANWSGSKQYFQDVPEEADRTLEEILEVRSELAKLTKRLVKK